MSILHGEGVLCACYVACSVCFAMISRSASLSNLINNDSLVYFRGKFNQMHHNQQVGCLDQRYKMHVDFSADWVNIV